MEEFEGLKIPVIWDKRFTNFHKCLHQYFACNCIGISCSRCIYSKQNRDAWKRYQNQTKGKEMETDNKWRVNVRDTIVGENYISIISGILYRRVSVEGESRDYYFLKGGTDEIIIQPESVILLANKNPNQITVGDTKPGEYVIIDEVEWQRLKGTSDDSRSVYMVCQSDYVSHYRDCSIPCERIDK